MSDSDEKVAIIQPTAVEVALSNLDMAMLTLHHVDSTSAFLDELTEHVKSFLSTSPEQPMVDVYFKTLVDGLFSIVARGNKSKFYHLTAMIKSLVASSGNSFSVPCLDHVVSHVASNGIGSSSPIFISWIVILLENSSDVVADSTSTKISEALMKTAKFGHESFDAAEATPEALQNILPKKFLKNVGQIFVLVPAVAKHWIQKITSVKPITQATFDLFILSSIFASIPQCDGRKLFEEVKGPLTSVIANDIFASRDAASPTFTKALAPLFSLLSESDMSPSGTNNIGANISRMLKRGPNIVFIPTSTLFKFSAPGVALCLAPEVLSTALPELRSADSARRNIAKDILVSLASNLSLSPSTEVTTFRTTMISTLADNLLGRNSTVAISSADARASFASALGEVTAAANLHGELSQSQLDSVANDLIEFSAKDSSTGKDVSFNAVAAAFSSLSHTTKQKIPSTVGVFIASAISSCDINGVVFAATPALKAAVCLLESKNSKTSTNTPLCEALCGQTKSAVDKLNELIIAAESRPAALRSVGLLAASLLLTLTKKDEKKKKNTTEKSEKPFATLLSSVFSILVAGNSFINEPSLVKSASQDDNIRLIHILSNLASFQVSALTKAATNNKVDGYAASVITLLTSPSTSIRAEAHTVFKHVFRNIGLKSLAYPFLTTLRNTAPAMYIELSKTMGLPYTSHHDRVPSQVSLSLASNSRELARVLKIVSISNEPKTAALSLLLASSPFFSAHRSSSQDIHKVEQHINHLYNVSILVQDHLVTEHVVKFVFGDDASAGLVHECFGNEWLLEGSSNLFSYLAQNSSRAFISHVKPKLLDLLSISAIDSLIEAEKNAIPPSEDSKEAATFDASAANALVTKVSNPIAWDLAFIRSVALSSPALVHNQLLFDLIPRLEYLMKARVLVGSTTHTIKSLANALQGLPVLVSQGITSALVNLMTWKSCNVDVFAYLLDASASKTDRHDSLSKLIAMIRTINAVVEATEDHPLTGPSFRCVFPVLETILRYAPLTLESIEALTEDEENTTTDSQDTAKLEDPAKLSLEDTHDECDAIEDQIFAGVAGAAGFLASHAVTAASSNIITAQNPVSSFDVGAMLSITLLSIGRIAAASASGFSEDLLEAEDKLTTSIVRLCPTLSVSQTKYFLSDDGLFNGSAAVRIASLRSLAVVQVLLASTAQKTSSNDSEIHNMLIDLSARISILTHDPVSEVSAAAKNTWNVLKLSDIYSAGQVSMDETLARQITYLSHPMSAIRDAAAESISSFLVSQSTKDFFTIASTCLKSLRVLYFESADQVIPAIGLRGKARKIDNSPIRLGVASCFLSCASIIVREGGSKDSNLNLLREFFSFILNLGFADRNQNVWEAIERAALKATHLHGSLYHKELAAIFDLAINGDGADHPAWEIVASANKKGSKKITSDELEIALEQVDRMKEGAVLLLGTVARYFTVGSLEIVRTFEHLLKALDTDSYDVKRTVAACMSPLVPMLPRDGEFVDTTVRSLMNRSVSESKAHLRLGCARGFAAMIKGLRGPALSKYNVFEFLSEKAGTGKADAIHGTLAVYGYLFEEIGSVLSPFVTRILPNLLPSFGHGDTSIRNLAQDVAAVLMRRLTTTGVKMVLPTVLQGIADKSWRAKVESIQLLGSMGSLAPRELAAFLPAAIPRLLDALTDPNAKVQDAARDSIHRIGLAVQNPELRRLAPTLVAGLTSTNPEAVRLILHQLLTTTFRHYVDPASLALVMPLVRKGLRDVDVSNKKHAVQIAGAISLIVTSPQDMVPYMPALLVYLRQLVMDSMPDVRLVTSRAIAAMYRTSKSPVFEDFLTQLIGILDHAHVKIPTVSDQNIYADKGTTGVQRLGAALCTACLLHVQGLEPTAAFLETFPAKLADSNQYIRESYIMSLSSIPQIFGPAYAPMLESTFPYVLQALSDSAATCRELATRAGQQLVIAFARTQTTVFVPLLMEALTDDDSRVRQGAVMLTANLVLRLAGLSGKLVIAEVDDDPAVPKTEILNRSDSVVSSMSQERLVEDALGTEVRNELFSSIYLMRSDPSPSVSTIAWRVWKAIVPSSTRMLNNIITNLVDRIVLDIASWQEQRQITAGQAMADLVSKLGDRILRDVVPLLQDKLTSRDSFTRRGVCMGFTEIINAGSKQAVVAYMADLIVCVRTALCDEADEVRKAARNMFSAIYSSIGDRAVREVVPSMLSQLDVKHAKYEKAIATMTADQASEEDIALEKDESQFVIRGIREVLSIPICEKEALEIVIPFFIRPPVSTFHSECLAIIAGALGHGFVKYAMNVADSLLSSFSDNIEKHVEESSKDEPNTERIAEIEAAQQKLADNAEQMFAGFGPETCTPLLDVFLQSTVVDYNECSQIIAATRLLGAFFRSTRSPLESHLNTIWRHILPLLLQDSTDVLSSVADAIGALSVNVSREILIRSIGFIRTQLNTLTGKHAGSNIRDIAELPGLGVNNCASHFIGFYQHGLVAGSSAVRVQSAAGLAELVDLASPEALRSSTVKLAGPLIRTFGDRHTSEIRASILQTLGTLVTKNGPALRAFQSQLQTTFVKALLDESPLIRARAAPALAQLMIESRRVDSLISELVLHLSSDDDINDGTEDADLPTVKTSIAKSIRLMYADRQVTSRLGPETSQEIAAILPQLVCHHNNPLRTEAARLTGAIVAEMDDESSIGLLTRIMSYECSKDTHGPQGSWQARQGAAMCLSAVEMSSPARVATVAGGIKSLIRFIAVGFNDENELACTAVVRLAGRVVLNANNADNRQVVGVLVQELLKLAVSAAKIRENVTLVALNQVAHFAEIDPSSIEEFNSKVIPLCLHARAGTGRPVRKEADTILYYCLGFHENLEEGMERAEEFASNFSEAVAQEFLGVCKRSVMKLKSKDDSMHATTATAPTEDQYEY